MEPSFVCLFDVLYGMSVSFVAEERWCGTALSATSFLEKRVVEVTD